MNMGARARARYRLFTCPVCDWVERRFCNTRRCQKCGGPVVPISREDPAGVVETAKHWGIREGRPRNRGRLTRVLSAASQPWDWWGHILAMAQDHGVTCNDLDVTDARELRRGVYMEVYCPDLDLVWRVVKLQSLAFPTVSLDKAMMGDTPDILVPYP